MLLQAAKTRFSLSRADRADPRSLRTWRIRLTLPELVPFTHRPANASPITFPVPMQPGVARVAPPSVTLRDPRHQSLLYLIGPPTSLRFPAVLLSLLQWETYRLALVASNDSKINSSCKYRSRERHSSLRAREGSNGHREAPYAPLEAICNGSDPPMERQDCGG